MKTKPFNLEEAKAGKKLVTQDGREARFLMFCEDAHKNDKVVLMRKETGRIFTCSASGSYVDGSLHSSDVYMLHEPVRRDWKLHEVPVNHWFRVKGDGGTQARMIAFNAGQICLGSRGYQEQSDLEHSADGIEWKECGIYE